MKPVDFEKILFPLNGLATAAVFFLIFPTTHIYAGWFPEKKGSLWLIPAGILFFSASVWFFTSLITPKLIRRGIFEDRRKTGRDRPDRVDISKVASAVLNFVLHMTFLLVMSAFLAAQVRSGSIGDLLFSRNVVWRAP